MDMDDLLSGDLRLDDGIEKLDLSSMCRACALQFPPSVLRHITPPICDMFAFCTGLEVELTSDMPTQLCGTCLSRADDASQFKMQSLRSEKRLRSYVQSLRPLAPAVSTPLHRLEQEHPGPECSVRSDLSDYGLPLTPLGCKFEDILQAGASPAFEENTSMCNFLNAILGEENVDVNKKNMIIEEIIKENPATEADRVTYSVNGKRFGNILNEEYIGDSYDDIHTGDTPLSDTPTVVHDIVPKENKQKLNDCHVDLIDFIKCPMPEHLVTKELAALGYVRCRYCYKTFKDCTELYNHLKEYHILECKTNKDGFDVVKLAVPESRVQECLKNGVAACRFCYMKFLCIEKFYRHLRRKHEQACRDILIPRIQRSNYICNECGKTFLRRKFIKNHLKSHKRKYCKVCCRAFSSVTGYLSHMTMHQSRDDLEACASAKERKYVCPTCGKRFTTSTNMNAHRKRHAAATAACPICQKTFRSTRDLARHRTTHEERSHECHICMKKFKRSDHLTTHYRIHSEEKPYRCKECGETFTQMTQLNTHVRCHTQGHRKRGRQKKNVPSGLQDNTS